MIILYLTKEAFEVILVFGRALMLLALESCVPDVRRAILAPIFRLHDQSVHYNKLAWHDMRLTVDFQYSDIADVCLRNMRQTTDRERCFESRKSDPASMPESGFFGLCVDLLQSRSEHH